MSAQPHEGHRHRYRQIADVLTRHGLGYLAGQLGLDRVRSFGQALGGGHAPPTPPEHVRQALAELGVVFIKLGQILSTRADLLPPAYQVELARLQDAAPPVPVAVIRETILAELGQPVEALFASFDPAPLAAASIAQVHAATLPDGAEVVIKVRRPGVVAQVERDLEILRNLASVASRRWSIAQEYDAVGLVDEFSQALRGELDFIREARNIERFAANLAGDPAVRIPRVYWETSTGSVLTLERLRGARVDDVVALREAGIDLPVLAERAARLVLTMIFDHGFFHADPHPGNFFIEPDGRIGLIDFGQVGLVDQLTRDRLVELLLAVASQDAERVVDALLVLGAAGRRVERPALRRDLEHLLAHYYRLPLGEIALGPLVSDSLGVIRRHHLVLPPTMALLLKTLIMNEGIGARLDPGFRLTTVLEPFAERLVLQYYAPARLARQLGQAGLDATRLGIELPTQLRRIITDLERGGLEVGMRPTSFEPVVRRLEHLANRIVLGIIAAAFINGLAILLSVFYSPGNDRWVRVLLVAGFIAAAILGAYLAWSILRPRRE